MTLEEELRARVLALTPVTALVSTRVYLDKLPQSPTYPCVLVTLISEPGGDYHLRGGSGLGWARVQVDAYAKELSGIDPYPLVSAVMDAINGDNAGSGLSGAGRDPGSPADSIVAIFALDRTHGYDPDELRVVHMSQDFKVWFRT